MSNSEENNRSLQDMMSKSSSQSRSRRGGGSSRSGQSSAGGDSGDGGGGGSSNGDRDRERDRDDGKSRGSRRVRRPPRLLSTADDRTVASATSQGSDGDRQPHGTSTSSSSSRRHHHHSSSSRGIGSSTDDRSKVSSSSHRSTKSSSGRDKPSSSSSSSRPRRSNSTANATSGMKSSGSSSRRVGDHKSGGDHSSSDEEEGTTGGPADFASAFGSSNQDAFGSSDMFGGGGGGASSTGAFGSSNNAAFGSSNAGFGSPGAFGGKDDVSRGSGGENSNAFESAFGSFPSEFGNFPTTTTTNTATNTSMMDDEDGYEPPSFGSGFAASSTFAKVDTSPIDNPPLPAGLQDLATPSTTIQLETPRPILVQTSPPTATPVANPLTGNIICCRRAPTNCKTKPGDWQLVEWNPTTQSQVQSVALFTAELQKKIAQKYKTVTAVAVETVLTLAAGVHTAHGYTRPRVACLMDVLVQDDANTSTTAAGSGKREVLRLIAIWQWGYGTTQGVGSTMTPLQSVLSPPSGSDFSYNPTSLVIADSCVFVSGASPKGPCVFLSKPTVKDTWSANFVGKESARIAHMAVTTCGVYTSEQVGSSSSSASKRNMTGNAAASAASTMVQAAQAPRLPYLAIALTDGSLSIWTYEAAIKVSSKTSASDTIRRLLYPLCRLEATKALRTIEPTDWDTNSSTSSANKEVGYCTHLEWVAPRVSAHNQLLLLAASFQGGICLYHVALPKVLDKSSTSRKGSSYVELKPSSEKTQLSQTPTLKPMGVLRFPAVHHSAYVSFCDLGPHLPPSLAVLAVGYQTNLDYARVALVTCPLAMYGSLKSSKTSHASNLVVWSSREFPTISSSLPRGLIPGAFASGIVYYSDTHLQLLELTQPMYSQCSKNHLTARLVRGGLGSVPAGLMTDGTKWYTDCTATKANPHKDAMWHVYTTLQCERKKNEEYLEWAVPSRRHWLVQTHLGDCKEASAVALKIGSDEDAVAGGTTTSVVCELGGLGPLSQMMPCRIVRHDGVGAIVFRSCTTSGGTLSPKTMIALVDESADEEDKRSNIVKVLDGRDVTFVPNSEPLQLLVLSQNGGSLTCWERKSSGNWAEVEGSSYRPLLGVDDASADDYVDCQRLLAVDFQEQVGLIAVGHKLAIGTSCIVAGKHETLEEGGWGKLLPNVQKDAVLWLTPSEQVTTVLSLPHQDGLQGGIAVATSQRIMILSPTTMKILSSVSVRVSPSSLVPMGSYTVAYASHCDNKIRYLSGVPGFGASGLIASFPLPHYDYNPHFILAIRPDRIIYTSWHTGTRLVERGQDSHVFLMPTAVTRPALLLEPMIANAIATGREQTGLQPFFRTVVEKFGRKVATMTHGEGEGIGNHGAGMTPRVFELLQYYNLKAAASWLLTGTTRFDRSANSRLLPAWMPIAAKVKAANDADTNLHVIANGDQYFSEYVKSPDNNMTATLPRPSDPSAFTCQHFAIQAMRQGNTLDAFKMLDMVGTEQSDSMMLQLALAMQVRKDVTPILNSFFQSDSQIGKAASSSSVASLAALAAELKKGGSASDDFTKQWMRPLAPSMQRGRKIGRNRPRIMGESVFEVIGKSEPLQDRLFSSETNESKLVWNEGPNREKENLLMLDHIQEWFGRRRPVILGKEGAKSAEDRGASTLADILAQPDDDSFGGDDNEDVEDGWADGVGEGQKDEDKLSAYYRFSEGEDEDSSWREEGFSDLSKYDVKAILVGCSDTAKLQESTTSVDEGDPGKVKAIFDIVFEQAGVGLARALAIPATRGGSLDIGMMHGPEHSSRQKCTVEFWFWVPENIQKEVILVRRTFGSSADDLDNVCVASAKDAALWELAVTSKGEVEFRTAAGGTIKSSPTPAGEDDEGPQSTVQLGKWNHVCFTMKQESLMSSAVNVLVKGNSVCSKTLNFKPPSFEEDDFAGASGLDTLLEKSHMVFGLDHPASFRLTELRIWATERDEDDIRTMMTEYLEPAEVKRKFKVKIKKKGGEGGKVGLPTPKGKLTPKGVTLAAPGGFAPPKVGLAPRKGLAPAKGALAPPEEPEKPTRKGLLTPPKGSDDSDEQESSPEKSAGGLGFGGFGDEPVATPTGFGGDAFGSGFGAISAAATPPTAAAFDSGFGAGGATFGTPEEEDEDYDEEIEISPLWDSAIPLSEQVRSSAAAALIRGPPATRHFGGNRGGLPDYRELERLGVGAISICGSEKTIVWRDDQVPPGLTYPIGASGAIVSDQMDEDGSEFLCCFLAKDKRMVVFELSTRTVVVELQMTTKLNYWRFLPPEAGEDTLCFMLVTPVGGFHWMPLDESPRPRQVWKRGPELQSKKIVSYEEGGTNGLDGPDMLSKAGMLLVTNASTGGRLEAWMVPICGDSQAVCASDDVLGACLCRPPGVGYEAWMPLLLFVVQSEDGDLVVCVSAVTETSEQSIGLTEVMTDALIEQAPYEDMNYDPPTLAMGTWPEVLCCSLGSTTVIIVRRKGLVVAYELADTGLELIAQEHVGHYVVDAVMRYSAVEGGAEIVLLMSDTENPRDGRVGTFCFRTAV